MHPRWFAQLTVYSRCATWGIKLPTTAHIPPSRLASLARFANNAKVTAVARLPSARRLATLIAFVHSLEAIAHDDALEVLDMLLQDLFGAAMQADKRARLRSLKDLDSAAITLAEACHFLLDPALPDSELRTAVFTRIPPNMLAQALGDVGALTRPPDDVFYKELVARYRSVRRFLPTVLKHIRFGANSCGEPVVKALDYLRLREMNQLGQDAPLAWSVSRGNVTSCLKMVALTRAHTPSARSMNCAPRFAGAMSL